MTFLDVYLRLQRLPYVGNIYVGKFKTPFGLEQLTSSRFTTFQENALTDAFVLGRELGFMLQNTMLSERLTWALAVTRQADNDRTLDVAGSGGDIDVTLRLTGVPWFANNGRRLVHIGGAYGYSPPNNSIRFRVRPEARLDDVQLVDTGPSMPKRCNRSASKAPWSTAHFPSRRPDYLELRILYSGSPPPHHRRAGECARVRPRRRPGEHCDDAVPGQFLMRERRHLLAVRGAENLCGEAIGE